MGDGVLEIQNAKKEFDGDYTCYAVNSVGKASDFGTVNVGPSLVILFESISVVPILRKLKFLAISLQIFTVKRDCKFIVSIYKCFWFLYTLPDPILIFTLLILVKNLHLEEH